MMFEFGFSTKFGGVSQNSFKSLNLALHVGDNKNCVLQNRKILQNQIKAKHLVFMEQEHKNNIVEISEQNLAEFLQNPPICDAIFTSLKNIALCVMVADCAPILLFDKEKIAAIHAGRAGVCLKILTKTIMAMKSNPKNIKIIIGPHIQKSCYQIGKLDLKEFNKYKTNGFFDINSALEDEIKELKINNYTISKICTHCDDNYFSYRKNNITGRFVGWIKINGS